MELTLEQILAIDGLVRREVVPATGCTEPVAVALCVARAAEAACGATTPPCRREIASVRCLLSGNMIKNAMGVGIPGTGQKGIAMAVALGATRGLSSRGLEVLGGVTAGEVARAREFLARPHIINIEHAPQACHKLHIDVRVESADGHTGRAFISGSHTNFVAVSRDGVSLFDPPACGGEQRAATTPSEPQLTMRHVWEYATAAPLHHLDYFLEAARLNSQAAQAGMEGEYGHRVGRTMVCPRQRDLMGTSVFTRMLQATSAACDARMGGATVAVMSNSGSGNQGIAATMPVVVYARHIGASRDKLARALALSNLTVIYIKQSLGRLSALCGCVVAAAGSAAGVCYLMDGGYEQVCASIKNMAATLTGMICDGAKASCSLKVASGVSTAVMSAMIAMEGQSVDSTEGIIDDDVDRTIANLTLIGREAMAETDRTILAIMTAK